MTNLSNEFKENRELDQSDIQELIIDPRYFLWETRNDSNEVPIMAVGRCISATEVTLNEPDTEGKMNSIVYKPIFIFYKNGKIGISLTDLKFNDRVIHVGHPNGIGEEFVIGYILKNMRKKAPNLTLDDVFLENDYDENRKEFRKKMFFNGEINSKKIKALRVSLK